MLQSPGSKRAEHREGWDAGCMGGRLTRERVYVYL